MKLKVIPKSFVGSTKSPDQYRIIFIDAVSVEAMANLVWMELRQLDIIKGWGYRDPARKRTIKVKGTDKETDWWIKDNPPPLEESSYALRYFSISLSKRKFQFKDG